jgi:hypothetical protein
MNRRRALIFFMFLCSALSAADAQVFDPAQVGPPLSQAPPELYLPIGAVPALGVHTSPKFCNFRGLFVVSAQAGTQGPQRSKPNTWPRIPAFAGMTETGEDVCMP